jgi:hypothetical protein
MNEYYDFVKTLFFEWNEINNNFCNRRNIDDGSGIVEHDSMNRLFRYVQTPFLIM